MSETRDIREIDPSIYSLPQIQRSMERINTRYRNDDCDIQTLWLRVPWKPGDEPITFTGEDRIIGCVAIYDPLDGQLIRGAP